MVSILLELVSSQLSWGHSVLVDSVFMGVVAGKTEHDWNDRQRTFEIAQKHDVQFRPIYFYISDEQVWQKRLQLRAKNYPNNRIATWSQVD